MIFFLKFSSYKVNINIMNRRWESQPKYKYIFNSKPYDLQMVSTPKQAETVKRVQSNGIIRKNINQYPSATLQIMNRENQMEKRNYLSVKKKKGLKEMFLKLPQIKSIPPLKIKNPEQCFESFKTEYLPRYYQPRVLKALESKQSTYLLNLCREHFLQSVQAIRSGKCLKMPEQNEIQLPKRKKHQKTIFLDLDETLIHCDESSTFYSTKLNFLIQGGGTISVGVNIRPYCQDFLRDLSSFAEIIIFTASSASYADVVLDFLDPNNLYISHRLYRQHCTLVNGIYTKNLKKVNRRLEDMVIVDNSAFCFMNQPQFGIPILPFYHYAKDKELKSLLEFLRALVQQPDMRVKVREIFLWQQYLISREDPRKLFLQHFPH